MLRTVSAGAAALFVALLSSPASAYSDWIQVRPAPGSTGYCAWPQLSSGTAPSINPTGLAVDNGTFTTTSCFAEGAYYGGVWNMVLQQGSASTPFGNLGLMNIFTRTPAYGASVSVTNVGHVFASRNDGSLWFYNGAWVEVQSPSQYWIDNVAAASDQYVYALSPNNCSSTDGGDCIVQSADGGKTFNDYGGTLGAASIAWDPVAGDLWALSRYGRVYKQTVVCTMWGTMKMCRPVFNEISELGLPVSGTSYGAVKIAAYNGVPYVIALTNSANAGPVYSLQSGVWRQLGSLNDAADIAVDRANGALYVTRYQGGSTTSTFDNIYEWMNIPIIY